MKRLPYLRVLTATSVLLRCGGTETDNPLTEDPTPWLSECKGGSSTAYAGTSQIGSVSQPLVPQATTLPAALACVHWDLDENQKLTMELNSFRGACGADFEARSNVENETVTLGIYNPSCRIAACGNCLYDSRFEVQLETRDDRIFALTHHGCDDEETRRVEWALPLSLEPSGTICEFADGWGLSKAAHDLVGQEFGLCAQGTTCEAENLTCIAPHGGERSDFNSLCVPTCQVDEDCPISELLECDAGVCKPRGR